MLSRMVLSFTLLYGAMIALICAVYVYLISRRNLKQAEAKNEDAQRLVEITD